MLDHSRPKELSQPLWVWPRGYRLSSFLWPAGLIILSAAGITIPLVALRIIIAVNGTFTMQWVFVSALFLSASIALGLFVMTALAVIMLRIFPCRNKPGFYPCESPEFKWFGVYYGLYQFVSNITLPFTRNTWIHVLLLRALGARLGTDIYVNTNWVSDPHLITIGSGTMIGWDVVINAHSGEQGGVLFDTITIGKNVSIGARSLIMPGAVIEDGVTVAACTVITKRQNLRKGLSYAGIPARPMRSRNG